MKNALSFFFIGLAVAMTAGLIQEFPTMVSRMDVALARPSYTALADQTSMSFVRAWATVAIYGLWTVPPGLIYLAWQIRYRS